jgi:NAD(P)-dependent dehydrogenase (short-subunit alcohol dehydrogenase family)
MTAPAGTTAADPDLRVASENALEHAPGSERRVALITGASSGIGRATARRFAARGWQVWASMRRPDQDHDNGQSLRDEAAEKGWTLETPRLDVTSDAEVEGVVAALLASTGGRLDLLVNNAGYYAYGALEDTSPDELRAQLETNVIGAHRLVRAVLPAMRARRSGRVIFLGSLSGLVVLPMVGPYHASKWAIEALAEALRYEVRAFGVDVVLVEPGPYRTGLHDNQRLAEDARRAASPYAALLASYERQARALGRAEVAGLVDVIERAATVRRPALRWPVGPSAFSAAYLRRLVPDRFYEWLIRRAFRG